MSKAASRQSFLNPRSIIPLLHKISVMGQILTIYTMTAVTGHIQLATITIDFNYVLNFLSPIRVYITMEDG